MPIVTKQILVISALQIESQSPDQIYIYVIE